MEMEHQSFWQLQTAPAFAPLPGDIQVNTVVVGAGICGLLCAYLLHRKGVSDIAVIDAGGVCGGVTAHTTAKITSQHGLMYARLLQGLGETAAAQYAAANEKAVASYRDIISRENIDCDFTSANAFIYTTVDERLTEIKNEVRAARKLGIAASLETETELPFPIKGAIKFPNQAYFHPLKFAFAILDILTKAGCKIYTDTTAIAAETGIVRTARGNIQAEHIVLCSHYPIIDKHSLLFTKVYQERSYVLALKGAPPIRDMYLDCMEDGFSFRPQRDENHQDMLLLGAYDHKSGHENKELHFNSLLEEAAQLYPTGRAAYMWSAQDCMTHDRIPYIGRYRSAGENIYVATGFNKWGMSSSMTAAQIIRDLIVTGNSSDSFIFSLERHDPALQAKSFVKETVDIVGNFLTHLTAADESLSDIGPNRGGVVTVDGKRVGVYRNQDGQLYAVNPACTHMGCAIKWNRDENTWDCTCHGSRFDYQGNVLGGPALKPLQRLEIDEE